MTGKPRNLDPVRFLTVNLRSHCVTPHIKRIDGAYIHIDLKFNSISAPLHIDKDKHNRRGCGTLWKDSLSKNSKYFYCYLEQSYLIWHFTDEATNVIYSAQKLNALVLDLHQGKQYNFKTKKWFKSWQAEKFH